MNTSHLSTLTNVAWSRYWSLNNTKSVNPELVEAHRQIWKVLDTEKEQQSVDFFRKPKQKVRSMTEQFEAKKHEYVEFYSQFTVKELVEELKHYYPEVPTPKLKAALVETLARKAAVSRTIYPVINPDHN